MSIGSCPAIGSSTQEERLVYVRKRYACISDCDQCGICATFHGEDPEQALKDYVEGRAELRDVLVRMRNRMRGTRW
ncbi:MAG: hypothetical protein IKF78_02905 [Atopobiaceae bacterium]|nr:hypothetical protein [Atopobiaceae bacterium]